MNFNNSPDRRVRLARWVARALGSVIAAFTVFMLLGHLLFEQEVVDVDESADLIGFAVGLLSLWIAASLLAGWRWERPAGISTVVAGFTLGIFVFFTAGRNEVPVALAMSIPIILIGCLFLLASVKVPDKRRT